MFKHSFKNSLKVLLRNKALVFWTLLFPILLSIFFKLALGNIASGDKFEKIPISVEKTLLEDTFFLEFIEQMQDDGYFEVSKTNSDKLLVEGHVIAHVKEKNHIITKSSGIKQSIVENIINSYLQNESTVINILKNNPKVDIDKIIKVDEYVTDVSNPDMNLLNTFFYTLIGMQAMYGYLWGIEVMYLYEANLSTKAKRNAVAPTKKSISLFASLLVAWIINISIVLITIAFCKFALNVEFGDRLIYILILVALGALTGVVFGVFIAVSNKKDYEFKNGLGVTINMLLSFLAGMMVSDIKIIIQRNIPILNKINPIANITDAMYSLYYYKGLERYVSDVIWLMLVTGGLLVFVVIFTRGKKYDTI